jgi:hypothetical protein
VLSVLEHQFQGYTIFPNSWATWYYMCSRCWNNNFWVEFLIFQRFFVLPCCNTYFLSHSRFPKEACECAGSSIVFNWAWIDPYCTSNLIKWILQSKEAYKKGFFPHLYVFLVWIASSYIHFYTKISHPSLKKKLNGRRVSVKLMISPSLLDMVRP